MKKASKYYNANQIAKYIKKDIKLQEFYLPHINDAINGKRNLMFCVKRIIVHYSETALIKR